MATDRFNGTARIIVRTFGHGEREFRYTQDAVPRRATDDKRRLARPLKRPWQE
jgi:hypothetical protein